MGIKILTVVGARPQFIKAATLSRQIKNNSSVNEVIVHTGQHFDANMSDVFFSELDIPKPNYNLAIGGGTHGQNTGRMLESIEGVLEREKPDWVLVYGDTDSTLAGALAASKLHIPLSHVESGLRSFNRRMPEEINRVLTDHISDLLFTPTDSALSNLAKEGIDGQKVKLVGDVMYDATLFYQTKAYPPPLFTSRGSQAFILCTFHRAENTDDTGRLKAIVTMINKLSEQIEIILPLHPRTAAALRKLNGLVFNSGVKIIPPVGCLEMVWLLSHCSLVLTDSGGVQKEAYFHQKPCLTMRDETEWVELVSFGFNKLISPFSADYTDVFDEMLGKLIPPVQSLYGRGNAAAKILEELASYKL